MLNKWSALPGKMKREAVKPYYILLRKKESDLRLKRMLDFFLAIFLTVILSPVMLVTAIAIKLDSRGPVFYRQERVTQYGRIYRIFKFRTMVTDADKKGPLVTGAGDARITKVGNKLRKCRLDELPQLFNIIAGDMTFVGTRPEVMKYVEQYTDEMYATLLLPAGVTSTASIAYKDEDDVLEQCMAEGMNMEEAYVKRVLPEKMKYNLEDIRSMSIKNDIRIMIKTVLAVLR